jgi:ribosomal protein S18 acetylase RimI-like enzyme
MRLDVNDLVLDNQPTDDFFLAVETWSQGSNFTSRRIVGCLFLDRFHSDRKEVVLMVHPETRRQGIARKLLEMARKECLSRGIRRLEFVCEPGSGSGQGFLQKNGAKREYAEYLMELQEFHPKQHINDKLVIRKAGVADLEILSQVLAADFGDSLERAQERVEQVLGRPDQRFYLATYGDAEVGCAEPVATLRVEDTPDVQAIYGFFTRPEYRGRGLGRQLLEDVIAQLQRENDKPVQLDVDTGNLIAQKLYFSVGFEIVTTYEYFVLELE